jgi:predicted amidohydrolase
VLLDRDGTIAKAIEAIDEATDAGASLLVFPEAWIPGYPTWVWTRFEHASEAHEANTDRFSAMVMSGSQRPSGGGKPSKDAVGRVKCIFLA